MKKFNQDKPVKNSEKEGSNGKKPAFKKAQNVSSEFEKRMDRFARTEFEKLKNESKSVEKPVSGFSKNQTSSNSEQKSSSEKKERNNPYERKHSFSKDNNRFQKHEQFKPSKESKRNNRSDNSVVNAPNYDINKMKKQLPEKIQKKILQEEKTQDNSIRLNRFISNAGIASRRDADKLIAEGQISVNGKIITEMGHKVQPNDVIKYGKKILSREKLVYILLNKPKDFITTTEDPNERKTVMDLIKNACEERVYPVGRLDRNTTGLLLLTNDGELAEKLSHPSNEIKKIYQVELNQPISSEDFEKISNGLELEDGFIKPDELALVTSDAEVVGIKIHSGKNRIVRRIFESLGYEVLKLDRTTYAGLDKKDLPRGKWRYLTDKEVIRLKFMI